MENLKEHFRIDVNDNRMVAELHCIKKVDVDFQTNLREWKEFLAFHKVNFGIKYDVISKLAENFHDMDFPIIIAEGLAPQNGDDGKIEYLIDKDMEMKRDENWDFRNVMKIPSVTKGQALAKRIDPTPGKDGKNVMGRIVKAIPGKPAMVRPGRNVTFDESSQTYYAEENGQFSISGRKIQVLPEYHVNETLSLKTGNLDFVGTIVIRGDVPSGFKVSAEGDIKIFGMVEAATISAKGSIYISEGIAGQEKGAIIAGDNLHIGYINQANVSVGNDLYVENSILHSECVVKGHVFSKQGNIIGGSLSAGKSIEAKDIGSRLDTKTEIALGVNRTILEKETALVKKMEELTEMKSKLELLGQKLLTQDQANPKVKTSLLRQKHSLHVVTGQLKEIDDELADLTSEMGNLSEAKLIVKNYIYQNVIVSFGKYKRIMKSNLRDVEIRLVDNEITVQQRY